MTGPMFGTDLARLVLTDAPGESCGRCRAMVARAGWRIEWSRLRRAGWPRTATCASPARAVSSLRYVASGRDGRDDRRADTPGEYR